MNDQDFEDKLRALTGALRRPDPTAGWKSEILARARSGAQVRTPRWLLLGLGMAWACSAVLRISTPDTRQLHGDVAGMDSHASAFTVFQNDPDTPLRAHLALQSNPEFPDLP